MVSSSRDASLRIWDLREKRLLFTLQGNCMHHDVLLVGTGAVKAYFIDLCPLRISM